MEKIQRLKSGLRNFGGWAIEQTEKLRSTNLRALQLIKERPVTSLLGALAAGFLIGRIIRTRG